MENEDDDDLFYTDEPMEIGEIIPDFLPPPHELIFKVPREKITMEIYQPILTFYKAEAERRGIPYSRLIRAALQDYAARLQQGDEGK